MCWAFCGCRLFMQFPFPLSCAKCVLFKDSAGLLRTPSCGSGAGAPCLDAFLVLTSACPLLRVTQRRNVIPGSALSSHLSACRTGFNIPNLQGPAEWDGADPGKCWRADCCASNTQLVLWWMCCCISVTAFGQGKRDVLIQLLPCYPNASN